MERLELFLFAISKADDIFRFALAQFEETKEFIEAILEEVKEYDRVDEAFVDGIADRPGFAQVRSRFDRVKGKGAFRDFIRFAIDNPEKVAKLIEIFTGLFAGGASEVDSPTSEAIAKATLLT